MSWMKKDEMISEYRNELSHKNRLALTSNSCSNSHNRSSFVLSKYHRHRFQQARHSTLQACNKNNRLSWYSDFSFRQKLVKGMLRVAERKQMDGSGLLFIGDDVDYLLSLLLVQKRSQRDPASTTSNLPLRATEQTKRRVLLDYF